MATAEASDQSFEKSFDHSSAQPSEEPSDQSFERPFEEASDQPFEASAHPSEGSSCSTPGWRARAAASWSNPRASASARRRTAWSRARRASASRRVV